MPVCESCILCARIQQKTCPLSFKDASKAVSSIDFSLIYSDLFLGNMTRIAFGDAASQSGSSSLPCSFDELSLNFLVSFCALCEKTIALGVFPCSRVLSSLSYNIELGFIRRLWSAFQWSKQNMASGMASKPRGGVGALSLKLDVAHKHSSVEARFPFFFLSFSFPFACFQF